MGEEREGLPTQAQYWTKSELVGALNEAVDRFEKAEARVGQLTQEQTMYEDTLARIRRSLEREKERAVEANGRITELEAREMLILAAFYDADYLECARICDEVLDTSGALLGRVRGAVLSTSKEGQDASG